MSKHFFNTIKLNTEELQRANARAAALEDLIENIYKANPNTELSPSQIHFIVNTKYQLNSLLTSVRRGLSNLSDKVRYEKKGEQPPLIKTENLIPGNYGKNEHTWKLAVNSTTTTNNSFTATNPQPSFIQATIFDISPVTASWDDTIDRQ